MHKIFGYECRRLLLNKFFFGILLIILFYGWQVLSERTLPGISRTAPFSAWSFGDYLSRMLPLLWIGALFFLTFFTSSRARRTAVLTDAAPAPPLQYALIRCAAASLGVFLLALACLAEAAVFYGYCFGWYDWSGLVLPALITLAPPLIFALGSGWFLGRIDPRLIYVWMPVPFLCAVLPLPEATGMLSGSFFTEHPLALEMTDPAFSLPLSVLSFQLILAAAGIAFLLFPALRGKRKNTLSCTLHF